MTPPNEGLEALDMLGRLAIGLGGLIVATVATLLFGVGGLVFVLALFGVIGWAAKAAQ